MSTYTIDYHVPGTTAPQPVSPSRLANLNYLEYAVSKGRSSNLEEVLLRAAGWALAGYSATDRRRFLHAFVIDTDHPPLSFSEDKIYRLAMLNVPKLDSVRDHTVADDDIATDVVVVVIDEEGYIYVTDQISDDADDFDDNEDEDDEEGSESPGDLEPLANKLWDHDRSVDQIDRQNALNSELIALLSFRSSQRAPLRGHRSFTHMAKDLVVSRTPGLRQAALRRARRG